MDERDQNPLDALMRSVDDEQRIDAGAADRIESRLRVAHAAARPPGSRWLRPALAATVALVAVAVLSVLLVVRDPAPSAALVVTDADNVTVRLPDGTVVADPTDGFVLPDGAIVEIGSGGTVTVGDVVLDTAGVLEVRDGRLVADVVATTTSSDRGEDPAAEAPAVEAPSDTTTTVVTTTSVPATTDEPDQPTSTAPPAGDSTTTTTVRDGRDEPPPDDVERDRADQPDEPTDTRGDAARDERRDGDGDEGEGRDDGQPRDGADDVTVTLALDLQRVDGGVRVEWAVDGLAAGWTVSVQRRIGDGAPTTVVVSTDATGAHLDQPPRDDGRPGDGQLRYRVVILDEAGGEVATGPSQSLR